MSGDPDLVRALLPLTEAIPLVQAALAGGALHLTRREPATPEPARAVLVQVTRADGTPVRSSRPPVPDTGQSGAHCDLCHEPIAADHAHLIDVTDRSLHCVCRACGLLFTSEGAGAGRFRAVPDRYEQLRGEAETPWMTMEVPVGLAYFIKAANGDVAAFYPSPAGATQSPLSCESWQDLLAGEPRLATLEADVEALLVRRLRDRRDAFIVPVDVCYELVGLVRRDWRGFDGGPAVRTAIDGLFQRVQARSVSPREGVSA